MSHRRDAGRPIRNGRFWTDIIGATRIEKADRDISGPGRQEAQQSLDPDGFVWGRALEFSLFFQKPSQPSSQGDTSLVCCTRGCISPKNVLDPCCGTATSGRCRCQLWWKRDSLREREKYLCSKTRVIHVHTTLDPLFFLLRMNENKKVVPWRGDSLSIYIPLSLILPTLHRVRIVPIVGAI